MAFTAAYWALADLKPTVIAVLGCDMNYPKTGATHFYGTGTPDPLRTDITLRSLEAKASRLEALAALQGTAIVNLSDLPSRLTFRRATLRELPNIKPRLPDTGHHEAANSSALSGRWDRRGPRANPLDYRHGVSASELLVWSHCRSEPRHRRRRRGRRAVPDRSAGLDEDLTDQCHRRDPRDGAHVRGPTLNENKSMTGNSMER
jgi:hypothetical protein